MGRPTKISQQPPEKRLSPTQVSRLRYVLFDKVSQQVEEAHKVVMGTHPDGWNPTQARVFSAMLNKVMPDLSANFTQHEHLVSDNPEKLSRQQLEEIAMGVNNIIDAEVIEDMEK